MQFQADITARPVKRPECIETTSLGAAYLAGLATGYWSDMDDIIENLKIDREFLPSMNDDKRNGLLAGWKKAVRCVLEWSR